MRFRNLFLIGGSALVLGALLLTDPDKGISTALLALALVTPLLAVAFSHLARRGLFDYLDMRKVMEKALESATGAGLVWLGTCVVIAALLALFGRSAHASPVQTSAIPSAAMPLLPTLQAEIRSSWPDHPMPAYFGGLVEHESCITLTHPRCWQPTSRLKTAREEGAGLGQLTRAWSPDGALRFDALQELRDRHPAIAQLGELDWASVYQRPELQLRALVLKSRDDWHALPAVVDQAERLAMVDAAYNGGMPGLQRERRACQIASGCDPGRWWGHVEAHCLKSRQALYAGRSACDINRHHVADVIRSRAPKYSALLTS